MNDSEIPAVRRKRKYNKSRGPGQAKPDQALFDGFSLACKPSRRESSLWLVPPTLKAKDRNENHSIFHKNFIMMKKEGAKRKSSIVLYMEENLLYRLIILEFQTLPRISTGLVS